MRQIFQNAQWIWTAEAGVNQYVEFRRDFFLEEVPAQARLFISADNEYVVYLNGVFAGCDQYDDFPMHKSYDEIDVSHLLRAGENRLEIHAYHQGEGSFQYLPGPAGLIFALEAGSLRLVSGPDALARESALYTCGPMEKVSGQLGFTFHCDATRPEQPWAAACVVDARAGTALYPRPVKRLEMGAPVKTVLHSTGGYLLRGGDTVAMEMQRAFLSPVAEGAEGAYFLFDLGREEVGLPSFRVFSAEEATLRFGYGEHLEDLRPRTWVGGRNFAFSYRVAPGETQFTHYFRRIAGRYLMVFAPKGVQVLSCTVIPMTYPVSRRGSFRCGDSLMNRIFDISRQTLENCMHEHYEDCPWREQALYAMDSRNQTLCGYYAFGEHDFAAACLRLMAEGRRPDGLLEICAPAQSAITIPSFGLGWIFCLRDLALYTGDLDAPREMMPTVRRLLGFFLNRMENGLVVTPREKCYWNFYEWAHGLDDGWDYGREFDNVDGSRLDAPINLMLSYALFCAAQLANWTGDIAYAEDLRARQSALNVRCNETFWAEEAGLYRSFTAVPDHFCELTQALALLSGAATGDRATALRRALAAGSIEIPTTLSYALFKYEAMIADPAFRRAAVEDCLRTWGEMTLAGATSFWETIRGAADFDNAGSLCHGWSAVPAWLWFEGALGVHPLEPGFRRFSFDPLPEIQAHAVVPTPFGDMHISGNTISYNRELQKLQQDPRD